MGLPRQAQDKGKLVQVFLTVSPQCPPSAHSFPILSHTRLPWDPWQPSPVALTLTYHPEDHGGGVDASDIGGHAGVVAGILEAYVIELEGQDFLVLVALEVGLLRDCEL